MPLNRLLSFIYALVYTQRSNSGLVFMQLAPIDRLKLAFAVADKKLNIPPLLDDDAMEEFLDERSVLTYLSFFYNV